VFAKSCEKDFWLKTLREKKKLRFQSVQEILRTGKIRTNTKSFGKQKRIACSIITPDYLKTYRSQGLIFTTSAKPGLVYPFDLVLLTDAKKLIVQYYRIKENLGDYYAHKLIKGCEKFVFKSFEAMRKQFPTKESIWRAINKFRVNAGYKSLPDPKKRLIQYCEVNFFKPIKIKPIAVFGYTKLSRDIARKHGLPHFTSVKKFYAQAAAKPRKKPRVKRKPVQRPKPRRGKK